MKKIFILLMLLLISFPVYALDNDIRSENAILYNLNDDKVIFEKNSNEKTAIASLTKIMTVLVALQEIDDIDKEVVLTDEVFEELSEANASVAGFIVGQTVTYEDLLYGAFLPSGADATNALAINLSGSIENFVEQMNEETRRLNLSNTHFTNTAGLDDDNHYSTVSDVALILKEALQNETFKEIFLADKYITSDRSLTFYSTLDRTLSAYSIDADYIIGGKTGYTYDAGRCLASVAYDEENDIYYLLVTAKAPITTNYYHLLDAKDIYEHYFENYQYFNLVEIGDEITRLKTKYAKEKEVTITSPLTVKKYLKNDFDIAKMTINYDGENIIEYNAKKDSQIGTVYLNYEGEVISSFNVFLNQDLHFSVWYYIKDNIVMIIIIIFIAILFWKSLTTKKRKYKRKHSKTR